MAGRTRGVGAHTDFGALTLLLQDDSKSLFLFGGLSVQLSPRQFS